MQSSLIMMKVCSMAINRQKLSHIEKECTIEERKTHTHTHTHTQRDLRWMFQVIQPSDATPTQHLPRIELGVPICLDDPKLLGDQPNPGPWDLTYNLDSSFLFSLLLLGNYFENSYAHHTSRILWYEQLGL